MDPLGSDSLASRQVHVTVASEAINWKLMVNQQLLTELAKDPRLKITGFFPGLTPEQETHARSLGIELVDRDDKDQFYAFSDSELLSHPPDGLEIDIFLIHAYESGFGKQGQVVRKHKKCKWVQVVHMISEEILPFLERPEEYKDEHKLKIGLCEKADLIVAIGPKVAEAYRRALSASRSDKKLIEFVPGIIEELSGIHQVHENNNHENFVVLVSGSSLHFKVKGLDIAAQALCLLDKSYHLIAVLRSDETSEEGEKLIRQSLLKLGIDSRQLKVRKPKSHLDWQGLLGEVDLLIKPSRTEGFGMSGLLAISASLPVLVSTQCGLGAVISKLPTGKTFVVTSDDPKVWADKIREMRGKDPHRRHSQAEKLKEEYANHFNQKEQYDKLANVFVEMARCREDTQSSIGFSNCQEKEIHEGAPLAKRAKLSQDDFITLAPSDEMLGDLAKDITSFWKHLGRKLKVANENIDEIQADNVQYPDVREKSFQMLMVWKNNVQSPTITELSRALKALGKNRIEKKYCSGSSFMDNTAI